MKKLMKKIDNDIESMNLSLRSVAEKINVDYSVIRNGVKGKTAEMKFKNFLKLVTEVYHNANEKRERVTEFIKICRMSSNAKKCLVYCQCAGEFVVADELILKQKESIRIKKKKKDKKQAELLQEDTGSTRKEKKSELEMHLELYELYNKRNHNQLKGQDLIDKLYESSYCDDVEYQVLFDTLFMAALYDVPNIHAMKPYADKILVNLDKLEDGFIKECLQMLCFERIAFVHLLRSELENSREICYRILDSKLDLPIVKATAYCCIGESYFFQKEDLRLAESYIEKGIRVLEDVVNMPKKMQKYRAFKTTLAHYYIENNMSLHKIDFTNIDITEEAFYECSFGDFEKGLKLYKQVEEEGKWSPFVEYSFAKVTSNRQRMKKALLMFEQCGHIHYANLVKQTLLNEGMLKK
ncbi:hypothetical protein IIU_00825 [Bacillus cereus VD133]|uniref:Prophage helix-turn-helix protein n=1 Tax=Bacillus cereus VD133 TaxID=1053233 RepID=A0A9W5PVT6_BACCE|nr:AimR family lysis-lysogeny pheromone receptor [Bacillus cereus]EOO39007.1 hypothetical protein IIU_00825 [Bacillus cereus VD133]